MQEQEQNYIKQVTIKGLWDKFDLDWELNPDVNILAGGNGMGKSTVLRVIWSTLTAKYSSKYNNTFESTKVELLRGIALADLEDIVYETKGGFKDGKKRIMSRSPNTEYYYSLNTAYDTPLPIIEYIDTFDTIVKYRRESNIGRSEKSNLDYEIEDLQKGYLSYQLDIAKAKEEIVENNDINPIDEIKKLQAPKKLFIEMLNELFGETKKKLNTKANEITFLIDDKEEIKYTKLSSGEKQVLIILLKTLIQNQQPAVMLLDEPEVSLHMDWQRKLISMIRQLNPNVQLIIVTHSPGIIMDGWMDKVFNIQDLMTPVANSNS